MSWPKNFYLLLTIAAIFNLCLIIFLIFPLFNNIRKGSEEIIKQKEALFLLEAKTKNLREARMIYQKIGPELEKTKSLFINPAMPVGFTAFLENLSRETNTDLAIVPLTQEKTKTDVWQPFFLQLNLKGAFPDFLKFLEKLENSPYLIEIVTLDVREGTNDKAKNIVATLTIKVFSENTEEYK